MSTNDLRAALEAVHLSIYKSGDNYVTVSDAERIAREHYDPILLRLKDETLDARAEVERLTALLNSPVPRDEAATERAARHRAEAEPSDEFLDWALEVCAWRRRAFPDESMEQRALCLAEEVGELCRTVLKESHGANDRRAHVDWKAERRKEVGDVFIALVAMCDRDGFDLMDALRERLDYVRERFPGSPVQEEDQ